MLNKLPLSIDQWNENNKIILPDGSKQSKQLTIEQIVPSLYNAQKLYFNFCLILVITKRS